MNSRSNPRAALGWDLQAVPVDRFDRVRTEPSGISNDSACNCRYRGQRNRYVCDPQTNCVAEYYVLTGETVVEGPFESHGEASRRKADLSTSDVGVTYRVARR